MSFLPFFSLETFILLTVFIVLFVKYGSRTFGVFEKLGIPGPKPRMYWGTVARHHQVYYQDDAECAKKYGRVFGLFELIRPVLAVMEPDMLKTILVKECFTHFTNRRNLCLNGELYDAVSISEDDQWRRIRNILTPSFTSGRIKEMFMIMKQHSRKLMDSLKSKVHNDEVIRVKDYFGGYSMDMMASCTFSVDTDAINNPSNPFVTQANSLFRFSIPTFLFQGFFPFFTPLLKLMGVSLFSRSATDFFKSVVEKIRADRRDNTCQQQKDILQHLINSHMACKNNKDKHPSGLSDHEIISQATILLFAGYETTAITLSFLAYNLARNPEVMKRLQEEIDSTFPNKGSVQYEALMQMEYLDSVVNESLRLYPPLARLDRTTKETVKVNGVTIPKGMTVMVPIFALHRDPELWPEPEEFRPDRFSKENKQSINPYSYLPFGVGPRNCLGMRFALVVVKLALVEVLQSYSFSVCKETEIPLQMDPSGLMSPLQPIKLKVVKRLDSSTDEQNCD